MYPGPLPVFTAPLGAHDRRRSFPVPFKVKSYNTEIVAQGPLFAEARVRYIFEGGYWTFTARVIPRLSHGADIRRSRYGNSGQEWNAADRFYVFTLNGNGFKPTQAYLHGTYRGGGFHDLLNQYVQPELQDGLERGGPGSSVNGYYPLIRAEPP